MCVGDPVQRALWRSGIQRLSPGLLAVPEPDLQLWPVGAGEEAAMLCGFRSQLGRFLAVWFGTGNSCSAPSLPQFSHLQNGHNGVTYLLRLAGGGLRESPWKWPNTVPVSASFLVFLVLLTWGFLAGGAYREPAGEGLRDTEHPMVEPEEVNFNNSY